MSLLKTETPSVVFNHTIKSVPLQIINIATKDSTHDTRRSIKESLFSTVVQLQGTTEKVPESIRIGPEDTTSLTTPNSPQIRILG